MTKPPEQPNEQWLDEILSKDRLTDVYSRNEQVIMVSGDLSSATPLKSAILKHTRSVEAIEAAIGENEIDFPKNKDNYWTYPKVRNRLRAEIRAALGLGGQDV